MSLHVRKRADKSAGSKPEGEPWPLSHVELLADELPDAHEYSDDYVFKAIDEGWMEFAGKSVTYKATPDPLGQFRLAGPITLTIKEHLVIHLVIDGEQTDAVYEIVQGPVPRGYRIEDPDEESGFAAPHSFSIELVKKTKAGKS